MKVNSSHGRASEYSTTHAITIMLEIFTCKIYYHPCDILRFFILLQHSLHLLISPLVAASPILVSRCKVTCDLAHGAVSLVGRL